MIIFIGLFSYQFAPQLFKSLILLFAYFLYRTGLFLLCQFKAIVPLPLTCSLNE